MSYIPVSDAREIDLTRHGLIEASAGTGKTYTIENLVVRLLKEREDVALENILMVTFTEKAAGELRMRIQEKIERELEAPQTSERVLLKLEASLDSFDQASIFTIHGFCQGVLRDFAFENSVLFESEVMNDGPLYESLLKEQMRKIWPETYGDGLKELLQISGFNDQREAFLRTVLELARSCHERAGDRLLPDLGPMDSDDMKERLKTLCLGLKALLSPPGGFSGGFEKLNIHEGSKRLILSRIVLPLEKYFAGLSGDEVDAAGLLGLVSEIEGVESAGRKGIRCLMPEKWKKPGPNPEVCPEIGKIVELFQEIGEATTALGSFFAERAIRRLQQDVARMKQVEGWISYYDMIALVEQALYDEDSTLLLERLRKRFKVGFIDEFQDTDPIQWKIFRRIFIDHGQAAPENLLFLIGDPKQAIYAFRGADVYAYLGAKKEMAMLEKAGRANIYSLSTNWRSHPGLVNAFNRLFGREAWFKPPHLAGEFDIGYLDAESPETGVRSPAITEDRSGRPPLNIVDLSQALSPAPAKVELAAFIAGEIGRLVAGSGIRLRDAKGEERSLDFGDIAVLVRGKSDLPFIEEAFSKGGIPYTFYKKPGLFVSDEAVNLGLVFHAILDPGNNSEVKKALLTPFFGFGPREVTAYDELPASHPVKTLLFAWNDYAGERRWSRIFQSLLEDSGLLYRESIAEGWDRRYTNYRQIFEYLEGMAYRKNLDFRGLSAALDVYRRQSLDPDEDADIHQIETEAEKVQVMTMHVSKGLQFPVVFIAGGLTQPSPHHDRYHIYHRIEKNGPDSVAVKCMDLGRTDLEGHEKERLEEDKRLLYVASTRSQFKLYLPFFPYQKKAPWVGPVTSLLSPALEAAFGREVDHGDVLRLRADSHADMRDGKDGRVQEWPSPSVPLHEIPALFPPQEDYRQRKIYLTSFSSLHEREPRLREMYESAPGFQAAEVEEKEDDEGLASEIAEAPMGEGPMDNLPGGVGVGSMFHDILERIDYETVSRIETRKGGNPEGLLDHPGTRDLILTRMEAYQVEDRWLGEICGILWNTLTTPIPPVGDDFRLCRLKEDQRIQEVAFYFPFAFPDGKGIAECETRDGFVRGFVDLVFRYRRRFYILDWKSNHIASGYHRESMGRNMDEAGYVLQYKLYTVAVLRWLKQAAPGRFDPETHFGGVFYLYLRGMGTGEMNGIYYVPAEELTPLTRLEEEVSGMISHGG